MFSSLLQRRSSSLSRSIASHHFQSISMGLYSQPQKCHYASAPSLLSSRKQVHLLKLPYPIGTIERSPFENYLLTDRIIHMKHSNNFRVLGAKFEMPSVAAKNLRRHHEENYENEVDVSRSIDALLQKEDEKELDDKHYKKFKELNWDVTSDSDHHSMTERDAYHEKRKYLRTLFASTNNRVHSASIAKLSVPKSVNIENYFQSNKATDLSYDIITESVTELKNVDIDDLEFNPDDGSVEMRLCATSARVVEERSKSARYKRRRNAIMGLLLFIGIAYLFDYTSESMNAHTREIQRQNQENGVESRSGEDVSKSILSFAANQKQNREQSSLEKQMEQRSIPAVDRMRQQNFSSSVLALKKRESEEKDKN